MNKKVDLAKFRQIYPNENLYTYARYLSTYSHGSVTRRNGKPYRSHFYEIKEFLIPIIYPIEKPFLFSLVEMHDTPEDSITSKEEIPLMTFSNLFNLRPDKERIVNPIGLLTKMSDKKIKSHLGYVPECDNERYSLKTERIIGKIPPVVLGNSVSLEDRVRAGLIYLGDLDSNGNKDETLCKDQAKMIFESRDLHKMRSYVPKEYKDEVEKLDLDRFLDVSERKFVLQSTRNALRKIVLGGKLLYFLNDSFDKFDNEIYNIYMLSEKWREFYSHAVDLYRKNQVLLGRKNRVTSSDLTAENLKQYS